MDKKEIVHVSMHLIPVYTNGLKQRVAGAKIMVYVYRERGEYDDCKCYTYVGKQHAALRYFQRVNDRLSKLCDRSHVENYAYGVLHYTAYFNGATGSLVIE